MKEIMSTSLKPTERWTTQPGRAGRERGRIKNSEEKKEKSNQDDGARFNANDRKPRRITLETDQKELSFKKSRQSVPTCTRNQKRESRDKDKKLDEHVVEILRMYEFRGRS